MSLSRLLLIAAIGAACALPAGARPRDRDQEAAFRATQEGRAMKLKVIEAKIVPRMRGYDYLGPEYYPEAHRYRLKFIRGEQVVWIDVDERTGEVAARWGY